MVLPPPILGIPSAFYFLSYECYPSTNPSTFFITNMMPRMKRTSRCVIFTRSAKNMITCYVVVFGVVLFFTQYMSLHNGIKETLTLRAPAVDFNEFQYNRVRPQSCFSHLNFLAMQDFSLYTCKEDFSTHQSSWLYGPHDHILGRLQQCMLHFTMQLRL